MAFFYLVLFTRASPALALEFDDRISIAFESLTIDQALEQLGHAGDIHITIDQKITLQVPKEHFENRSIPDIVLNLLRGISTACVFRTTPDGTREIHIHTFGDLPKRTGFRQHPHPRGPSVSPPVSRPGQGPSFSTRPPLLPKIPGSAPPPLPQAF